MTTTADVTVDTPTMANTASVTNHTDAQAATAPASTGNPETARAFAITSFVLGLASFVSGWTFVVPLVGLILGVLALRRKTTERTLALWGVWINAAMLAFTAIIMLIVVVIFAFGVVLLPFVA